MGQKVLICEFDIFGQVGGGQTVYQNIVRGRPENTFYYFTSGHSPESGRPANAIPIPFRSFYAADSAKMPWAYEYFFHSYCESLNMARSVREAGLATSFDVVDTPDYRQNGLFLRTALESNGLSVGTVALALHGTLSSAFIHGWPWTNDAGRMFAQMRVREHMQFRVVDARYAISEFYRDELQRYAQYSVNMLDPLTVVRKTEPVMSTPENRAPDLLFVGRREKRKGPDLFVDTAWWLPEGSFRRLLLIGGDGPNHQGLGSQPIIEEVARHRRLDVSFAAPMSQAELQQLYRQKSLVFIPSRYDQFNLVALETLLDGCPVVVSRGAGIAQFIERRLPEMAWLLADITCDRSAAAPMRSILEDYDRKRQGLIDALRRAALTPDRSTLQRIYEPTGRVDNHARGHLHDIADRFAMNTVIEIKRQTGAPKSDPTPVGQALLKLSERWRRAASALTYVRRHAHSLRHDRKRTSEVMRKVIVGRRAIAKYGIHGDVALQMERLRFAKNIIHHLIGSAERTPKERLAKLGYLNNVIGDHRIGRVRYFREMVRLERLRGNDLVAATYALRIIRWLDRDPFGLLDFVQNTLRDHGFLREADVAQAMYGNPANAFQQCQRTLTDQLHQHRSNPERPLQLIEDRRGTNRKRVSIIVSLYNAAEKLPVFWKMLAQQTMVRSGEAEIILVDSGSPTNEFSVFKALHAAEPLPVLYARSENRETIQMAWNRGINLASGDYLAFLGVDEGVHPDCYQILSEELDRDPALDWVMADSVVTEVDHAHVFKRDVMIYDRTGYRHDWHYLDCTFLSYVGGLYRRTIHDRYGYYDESFRAAGDTEFKNRILPFIKSKYVPKMLGVFNNYPEERTTQHPRAEIEDLRAWYLHRTPAGMAHAFASRSTQDIVDLLSDTLAYRKCYCRHTSSDIELTAALAPCLAERPDASAYHGVAQDADAILALFRKFEQLEETAANPHPEVEFARDFHEFQLLGQSISRKLGGNKAAAFDVFHDNRYEQHWWSWSV